MCCMVCGDGEGATPCTTNRIADPFSHRSYFHSTTRLSCAAWQEMYADVERSLAFARTIGDAYAAKPSSATLCALLQQCHSRDDVATLTTEVRRIDDGVGRFVRTAADALRYLVLCGEAHGMLATAVRDKTLRPAVRVLSTHGDLGWRRHLCEAARDVASP